jgi:hypothetical protein
MTAPAQVHIRWTAGAFAWAHYCVYSTKSAGMVTLSGFGGGYIDGILCWHGYASDPEAAIKAATR